MSHLLAVVQTLLAFVVGWQQIPAELHTYAVDREASQLYVVVHRAGLLSFLGHEHAIIPMQWSADLCLADGIPEGAHAALVLQTNTLVIDSDSARALAQMGGGPDDQARQEIHDRMLDSEHLDAEQYPEIRLDLVASAPPEGNRVTVRGAVSLHGVTRNVEFPVTFQRSNAGRLVLSGTLRIRQRDFGIEPESKAGLVKVSNDVDLHFRLTALPTEAACTTSSQ
jgi:polyisoprenoid-binding protein YceI